MDRSGAESRQSNKRQPLGDGTSRANAIATPPRRNASKTATSPHSSKFPPHHESLAANGGLTVKNATSSPENKQLSAITTEEQFDSKRSSQISTTSTNASAKGMRRKTHVGPWQLGKDIGKGACGKVRKVKHVVTGQYAAVKIVEKKAAELSRAESLITLIESSKKKSTSAAKYLLPFGIEREVVIMKLLEHPNVVRLYDLWENRNELLVQKLRS